MDSLKTIITAFVHMAIRWILAIFKKQARLELQKEMDEYAEKKRKNRAEKEKNIRDFYDGKRRVLPPDA